MDLENEDFSTESLINESKQMLDKLYKNHYSEDTKIKITSQDSLREEIMSFIGNQVRTIDNQNLLQDLIIKELAEKIVLHDMSTDELRGLLKEVSTSKSTHTTALLDMFKPTQNTNTMLTPPEKNEEVSEMQLTSEQRQSLEKFNRLMNAYPSLIKNIKDTE